MAQGTAEVKGEDPGKLGLAEDLPYRLTWDLQDPYAAKLEITLSVDGAEPQYIDRDRKGNRLNSIHGQLFRMPAFA